MALPALAFIHGAQSHRSPETLGCPPAGQPSALFQVHRGDRASAACPACPVGPAAAPIPPVGGRRAGNKGRWLSAHTPGTGTPSVGVVERLQRTVKYEEVYLKDCAGAREARARPEGYFGFYNSGAVTPAVGLSDTAGG